MAYVFAACVLIVTAGVIWFHIVRPILEDYGVIRTEAEPENVNRSQAVLAEPEPRRSIDVPRVNQLEPDEPPFVNAEELHLNADEVVAVARMIKHNATAAKPSKSATIQAGFGVSRGGSAAYQRASAIYDILFGQPAPAIETPLAGRRTRASFPSDKASQSAKY